MKMTQLLISFFNFFPKKQACKEGDYGTAGDTLGDACGPTFAANH